MRAIVAIIGLVLLVFLNLLIKRRERDREREAKKFTYITGSRRWWREPPSDGPEGDH
jgi:hypothetical protein